MVKFSARILTGILLALLSLAALMVSFQPLGRSQQDIQLHGPLEGSQLRLDLPNAIWGGETGRAFLILESGDPTAMPDLQTTDNQVLEARLELAGIVGQPQGSISETMQPGQTIRFAWDLSAAQPGDFHGTLWVYLDRVPKAGGDVDRQALLALPVEIAARAPLLGLPVPVTRWVGALGFVFGFLLALPLFISFLHKSS